MRHLATPLCRMLVKSRVLRSTFSATWRHAQVNPILDGGGGGGGGEYPPPYPKTPTSLVVLNTVEIVKVQILNVQDCRRLIRPNFINIMKLS